MKPIATNTKGAGRNLARVIAGNQGGFMIVLTLLVLFILTLLGMSSLLNSTIETKIAANENFANQALYAADTGLNHALTLLNNEDIDVDTIDYGNSAWCYPADGSPSDKSEADGDFVVDDLANRTLYRWYMRFKQDIDDIDSDGDTNEITLFNQAFGYPSSLFTGAAGDEGYPVIEIYSDGFVTTTGDRIARRRLVLELGRNQFDVEVDGGLTARSNVGVSGNNMVDGRNHTIDGSLGGSCGTDMPGVFVDIGKTASTSGSGSVDGTPPTQVNDGSVVLATSPWELLGIDQVDFESFFPMITPPSSGQIAEVDGNNWVTGVDASNNPVSLTINQDSTTGGILIVHNQNYDPPAYEASFDFSDPGSASYDPLNLTGNYLPQLDSSSTDYDPTYFPAEFTMQGNGVFKGVIIADTVIRIAGTATIIGAVMSLTGGDVVETMGLGTGQILYSCEAVQNFTKQGYATKLVWRRL